MTTPKESARTDAPKPHATRPGWQRMVLEWGGVILFIAFLKFTGPGTTVLGWMQQGVLATGLFQADTTYVEEEAEPASYELALESIDGRPAHLESMRGKTIFLNLWATWCAPCLAEMPYIQELYEEVGDEGIEFVIVATDDDFEVSKRFIEQKGYTFPVYRVIGSMPPLYRSPTLPTTWVISPEGNLATVHAGMANYSTRGFIRFIRSVADIEAP